MAQKFETKWNFPNCVGAIDGKHVVMQAPPRSGSTFFNYKGSNSIVLMAVVNSDYEFTLVDIGEAGRQSDGGVFANGHVGYAMNNDFLGLPAPRRLSPGSNKHFPYVFTGDEAFLLKHILLSLTQDHLLASWSVWPTTESAEPGELLRMHLGLLLHVFEYFEGQS